jgi:hypothetical protein
VRMLTLEDIWNVILDKRPQPPRLKDRSQRLTCHLSREYVPELLGVPPKCAAMFGARRNIASTDDGSCWIKNSPPVPTPFPTSGLVFNIFMATVTCSSENLMHTDGDIIKGTN